MNYWIMKNIRIVLSLTIAIIISSCPSPNGSSGVSLQLNEEDIVIDRLNNTLTLSFSSVVESFDQTKITLRKGSRALTQGTDYRIEKDGGNILIRFLKDDIISEDSVFTVSLAAGAVKDNSGNTNDVTQSPEIGLPNIYIEAIGVNITNKSFTITFNKPLSAEYDQSKLYLQQNGINLNRSIYEAGKISGRTLVIKKTSLGNDFKDVFTIIFEKGALSDTSVPAGKNNLRISSGPIDTTIPAIKSGKDALELQYKEAKKLILQFNRTVAAFYETELKIFTVSGGNETPVNGGFSAALIDNGNKLEIPFEGDFTDDVKYKVLLQAGALETRFGLTNIESSAEVAVPNFPKLVSDDLSLSGNVLSAVFDEDLSSKNDSKVEVYKTPAGGSETNLAISTDYSLAINESDKTRLDITLVTAVQIDDVYKIKFNSGAVTDTDNLVNPTEETNPYTVSQFSIKITSIAVNKTRGTISFSFNKDLSARVAGEIEVKKDNVKLASNSYTIGEISDERNIVITISGGMGGTDKYTVNFAQGSLSDSETPPGINGLLTSGLIDTTLPAIKAGDDSLELQYREGNRLILSLNRAVETLDERKVKISTVSGGQETEVDSKGFNTALTEDKSKLIIRFDGNFADDVQYKVLLEAGALSTIHGIPNAEVSAQVEVPDFPKPALGINRKGLNLMVTFDKDLQSLDSAKTEVTKTPVGGSPISLTLGKDYNLAIDTVNAAQLNFNLTAKPNPGEIFTIKFNLGALTDTEGISNQSIQIDPYTYRTFSSSLESIAVNKNTKTISFSFEPENLQTLDKDKVEISRNGSKLTTGFTIGDISGSKSIDITLTTDMGATDTYSVVFKSGSLSDSGTPPELNEDIDSGPIDTTLPGLETDGNLEIDISSGSRLIIKVNKVMKEPDSSKITVKKKPQGAAEEDITSGFSINLSSDKASIEIPFDTNFADNDQYRVVMAAGALIDRFGLTNTSELIAGPETVPASVKLTIPANLNWDRNDKVFTVTFEEELSTDFDAAKIDLLRTRSGESGALKLTLSTDYTLAVRGSDKKKFDVTMKSQPIINDVYKLRFNENAVSYSTGVKNRLLETNPFTFKETWKQILPNQAASSSQWSARSGHTSVVFKNKIWVMGGILADNTESNEIWSSEDGVGWVMAPAENHWTARYQHGSVVFDNKIWVIGGNKSSDNYKPIWSSEDGTTWTNHPIPSEESTLWSQARETFAITNSDDSIWIMGGEGDEAEVLTSSNGVNWSQLRSNDQSSSDGYWEGRTNSSSVFFNNSIWLMGGESSSVAHNEIWFSDKGIKWIQANAKNHWSRVSGQTSVVSEGKIWILGGTEQYLNDSEKSNNVWYSTDGTNWTDSNASDHWSGREEHTSVTFKDKIWVMGGDTTSGKSNDVWAYGQHDL